MWLTPGQSYKIVAFDAASNLLWSKDNVLTLNLATATANVTQASTGQFYQNLGANINRLNDRTLVGGATINDGYAWNGTTHGNQDYVSQNIPQGPSTALAQTASLSTVGGMGGLFGTRSSDGGGLGSQGTLAITGVAINDYTPTPVIAEAGYFEAQRKTGAGTTTAVEIDSVNQGGVPGAWDPYKQLFSANSAWSFGLSVAAGGARTGVSNSSAAINVVGNGAAFGKGLVFYATALDGSNEAVNFAQGHLMKWYTQSTKTLGTLASATIGSNIVNFTAGSYAPYVGQTLVFSDGAATFASLTPVIQVNSATQVVMGANALKTSSGLSFTGLTSFPTNYIQSQSATSNQDTIIFTDSGILLGSSPSTDGGLGSAGGLLIQPVNSATRYVTVQPSVAGNPTVNTNGGDLMLGSSTGSVRLGNISAAPTTVITNSLMLVQPTAATTSGGVAATAFGTTQIGICWGSGAPTLAATKGSLYLRTDGSGVNDRMYVNTNSSTTWTAVVTVA